MSQIKFLLTYVDSDEKAELITETLLKEKLAACVGIIPGGKSRYWWKGKIERNDNELHLIIRTKANLADKAIQKIKEVHSYELPVVDVIDIEKMSPGAEKWINEVLEDEKLYVPAQEQDSEEMV